MVLPELVKYFEFPRRTRNGKRRTGSGENNKSDESQKSKDLNEQAADVNLKPSEANQKSDVNGNLKISAQSIPQTSVSDGVLQNRLEPSELSTPIRIGLLP